MRNTHPFRLSVLDPAKGLLDDAVGERRDDVVLGLRARPGVTALLEQHPLVLPGCARLGDAHELPKTRELLAVELEQHLALGHAFPRVADGLPGATVPDDDRSGAVLVRRDGPFEGAVA